MNRETIAFLAASAGLAAVALAVALSAHRRLAVARRSLAVLQGSSNGKTLLDVVATYGQDLQLFEDGLNKIIERETNPERKQALQAALDTTQKELDELKKSAKPTP